MVRDMKGDIAFAGFMLTAEEWQALDADARAQLIAVATRRHDAWIVSPPVDPEPLAEGSGPLELDPESIELVEDSGTDGDA